MFNLLLTIGGALACTAAAVLLEEDVEVPDTPIVVPAIAETLVVLGRNVTTPNPNGKAVVRCWCEMTVGADTTGVVLAVYSGTDTTGRQIGTKESDSGGFMPGANATFGVEFIDPFENVSGVQYCLSVTQVGATANGAVLNALIDTKVLSG
jgi:hypothetical protein